MFDNIFLNKKVFITGHTGFKGSWLASWLGLLGAKVTGYALPPAYEESHFELLHLKDHLHHIEGNLLDYAHLSKSIQQAKPDFIFHLAAQALVRDAYDDPKSTFDTNIGGSVNLLESVRHCKDVKCLIYITSDKCYRNEEWNWGYRENDAVGGKDPYSASKGCAEIVFTSYYKSFFKDLPHLQVASVRAGNVIGGGDWAKNRLIPDCIRAFKAGREITIRNPEATRPWQHVLEPLGGYLQTAYLLFTKPQSIVPRSFNIGPEKFSNKTVDEVVRETIRIWGEGKMRVERDEKAPHEDTLLQLNCDLAYRYLNWLPVWHFKESIYETVSWYRQYHDGCDIQKLTESQIKKYMEAWTKMHRR